MPPTPTSAALERQAATLCRHPAALHYAFDARPACIQAEAAAQIDGARAAATTARATAVVATNRAAALHGKATELSAIAQKFEEDAARYAASDRPFDRDLAHEFRDQAHAMRASALGYAHRAGRAEQVGREETRRAQALEQSAGELAQGVTDRHVTRTSIDQATVRLEDKALALEDAATSLRHADWSATDADRQLHLGRATVALTAASAIQPDFGALDLELLRDAGVLPARFVPHSDEDDDDDRDGSHDQDATPAVDLTIPEPDDAAIAVPVLVGAEPEPGTDFTSDDAPEPVASDDPPYEPEG